MNTNNDMQYNTGTGTGGDPRQASYVSRKSPALAGFLSLMPGLGQIYLGYYQLGFVHMAIFAVTVTALSANIGGIEPLLGIFLGFFCLYNIIDAVRRATLVNLAGAKGQSLDELPDSFLMPGRGGTLAGGVVLIVIGAMILLETKFDVSMEWLEDWWSVLIIAGGIWLVVKARREKRENV